MAAAKRRRLRDEIAIGQDRQQELLRSEAAAAMTSDAASVFENVATSRLPANAVGRLRKKNSSSAPLAIAAIDVPSASPRNPITRTSSDAQRRC